MKLTEIVKFHRLTLKKKVVPLMLTENCARELRQFVRKLPAALSNWLPVEILVVSKTNCSIWLDLNFFSTDLKTDNKFT